MTEPISDALVQKLSDMIRDGQVLATIDQEGRPYRAVTSVTVGRHDPEVMGDVDLLVVACGHAASRYHVGRNLRVGKED